MANTYLTKTSTATGTNTKATFSAWVKRSDISSNYPRLVSILPSANNGLEIFFRNTDTLEIKVKFNSATRANLQTTRLFRDVNAWYHILVSIDSTSGTADDRVRLYINGVKETSFGTRINPDQNANMKINASGETFQIGAEVGGSSNNFSGSLSHAHWIDGTAYDASAFGETDATTGEWKGKTSPSVTYGTNGFFILKDGNGITDQSGEGNDFTLGGGTLTDLKDNPDNVFATLNPLYKPYASATFSEGNLKISTATGWSGNKATMGVSQGKWYWEIKLSGAMTDHQHGVQQENVNEGVSNPENTIGTTVFFNQDGGEMKTNGTATTADYGLFSTGDIMGVALDMDSGSYGQITIYKNGTPLVSNFNLSSSSTLVMPFSSIVNSTAEYNFGNGYFGTTAVTTNSGNGYSGAEGSSKFNYTVPAGYSALSTKGLNE